MRRIVAIFILLLSLSAGFAETGTAGDDIQGVTAVWRDFVASIRRGDYPNAHSLFSAQSRSAMPYSEFVAEYGPLSVAREMVLAKPESQATDLDDDWAEIVYGGVNPGSGRKFKVGVAFVKNEGLWGLVAARNETIERIEAGARALLRLLWQARDKADPRTLVETMNRGQAESPIMQYYRLETDGKTFRAFPLQKSVRTFYVDGWGVVKSVERDAPAQTVARTAAGNNLTVPAKSTLQTPKRRVNSDQMPELSEPGAPRGRGRGASAGNDYGEMSEPPPRKRSQGITSRPPEIALPETIR